MMSAGKDKFDARWKQGAWLGFRVESGESVIGTSERDVKARDFRRKAEGGGRWIIADFDKFVVVPGGPYSGAVKVGFELRSKVRLPADQSDFAEKAPNNKRGLGDVPAHGRMSRVQSGA